MLEIHVISACRLAGMNLLDQWSDPYVKVEVFKNNNKSPVKFKTNIIMKSLEPQWNEKFTVPEVKEETDLPNMSIVLTVKDWNHVRAHEKMGQVRLGPGLACTNYHWEKMLKSDEEVTMTHPIEKS